MECNLGKENCVCSMWWWFHVVCHLHTEFDMFVLEVFIPELATFGRQLHARKNCFETFSYGSPMFATYLAKHMMRPIAKSMHKYLGVEICSAIPVEFVHRFAKCFDVRKHPDIFSSTTGRWWHVATEASCLLPCIATESDRRRWKGNRGWRQTKQFVSEMWMSADGCQSGTPWTQISINFTIANLQFRTAVEGKCSSNGLKYIDCGHPGTNRQERRRCKIINKSKIRREQLNTKPGQCFACFWKWDR